MLPRMNDSASDNCLRRSVSESSCGRCVRVGHQMRRQHHRNVLSRHFVDRGVFDHLSTQPKQIQREQSMRIGQRMQNLSDLCNVLSIIGNGGRSRQIIKNTFVFFVFFFFFDRSFSKIPATTKSQTKTLEAGQELGAHE